MEGQQHSLDFQSGQWKGLERSCTRSANEGIQGPLDWVTALASTELRILPSASDWFLIHSIWKWLCADVRCRRKSTLNLNLPVPLWPIPPATYLPYIVLCTAEWVLNPFTFLSAVFILSHLPTPHCQLTCQRRLRPVLMSPRDKTAIFACSAW